MTTKETLQCQVNGSINLSGVEYLWDELLSKPRRRERMTAVEIAMSESLRKAKKSRVLTDSENW